MMSHTVGTVTLHEVQILQQELTEKRKQLQEYADTVVSLHRELRTLRESICGPCNRKFLPANLVSSQATADSSQRTNSRFSWRRRLKARASDDCPTNGPPTSEIQRSTTSRASQTLDFLTPQPSLLIVSSIPSTAPVLTTTQGNEKSASISNPLATTSSNKPITPKSGPNVPCWTVKRDATADAALDVTLVCAFNHKLSVRSVRFSVDGKYLAAALSEWDENGTIIIYDVETGKKTCVLMEYPSQYSSEARPGIHCACFSPDARYLAVGNGTDRVTVWDIPNKRIRNKFRGDDASRWVDFSPNGRLLVSASREGTLQIWNMRGGSTRVFIGSFHPFWSLRFSPNGEYIAAGDFEGILRIWDVRSGQLVKRWTGHKYPAGGVAFMPDGRVLVSGSVRGEVKCWDVSPVGMVRSEPVATEYIGHSRSVPSVAISPDGQWIICASDRTAILWDTSDAVQQYTLIGHEKSLSSVDFSPAGTYFAIGSFDHHVTLWRYSRL